MIDILVQGSLILTGSEAIRDGYVYISGGVIRGIGAGVPPEEYTRATLMLGGEGRIVTPGLTLAADVATYPFRFLRPARSEKPKLYTILGEEASFYTSLPALYELHLHGVTTVIIEFIDASLPLKLKETIGGFYGLLIPCGNRIDRPPALEAVYSYECNEAIPGFLEGALIYRPSQLKEPWSESNKLRKMLGLGEHGLKEGARAEISIFNSARPPGMLIDKADIELDTLYSLGLHVESLIVGDDVIVDRGEHLYITDAHLARSRSLSLRLISGANI